MYDPNSTEDSIISQKQLAYALGYPMNWRVERKIVEEEEEEEEVVLAEDIDTENEHANDTDSTHNLNDSKKKNKNQRGPRQRPRPRPKRILIIKDRIHADIGRKNQTKKHMWLHHEAAQKAAAHFRVDGTLEHTTADTTNEVATATTTTTTTTTVQERPPPPPHTC